jgi:GTP-binding protein EngB required for normal cell division
VNALAFDTLAYARRLEGAGFSRQQAETLAEEQARLIDERLATKTDIEALRLATKTDIEAFRLATKTDIEAFRLATKTDIEALRLATKTDIEALRQATTRDIGMVNANIEALRVSAKADLAETKADILKWMVSSIGIQTIVIVGAVTALVRIFAQ